MGNELGQLYLGFLYRQSSTHPTFLTGKDGSERRTLSGLVIPRFESVADYVEENNAVTFDGKAAQRMLGATVVWTREDVPVSLFEAFLEQWQIGRDGRRRGIVEGDNDDDE
jgi:hypothetical protein